MQKTTAEHITRVCRFNARLDDTSRAENITLNSLCLGVVEKKWRYALAPSGTPSSLGEVSDVFESPKHIAARTIGARSQSNTATLPHQSLINAPRSKPRYADCIVSAIKSPIS
ncbi:hypothetical protein [Paraburkholderia sp. JHI869]|uniref:hypothetical protein n=1 Tax=Paraburkholderia sp. JHI869 TaxID=3112959 RepID=UPI00319E7FE8